MKGSWKLLLACFALARTVSGQPAPDSADRLLQPGDQLEINILTLPEVEKKYQVRADGTFFHPYAGELKVAGMNLQKVEKLLRERFSKQLRNPEFRVGITTMADGDAAVLGEVRSQGKVKFSAGCTLLELLAQAGGVTEKADVDGAVLLRSGKQIPLNLGREGQPELARMHVQKGDILFVNRGRRIGVSGEVQAKGIYVIGSKSANGVQDAIKAAGGATELGALNRAQVIRPSLSKPIEVDLLNPTQSAAVQLEDGDTVLLPSRRAVVLGAVGKPGPVTLVGTETLLDVLSMAGLNDKARLSSLIVIRAADVNSGGNKKEVYNIQDTFSEDKAQASIPIRDGDVVFVPTQEENGMFSSNNILSVLLMARSMFAF